MSHAGSCCLTLTCRNLQLPHYREVLRDALLSDPPSKENKGREIDGWIFGRGEKRVLLRF